MPIKNGRETLTELEGDPKLKCIPVIILSTSNSQFDVNKTYEEGAALFISKPHDFNELVEMQNHVLSLAANTRPSLSDESGIGRVRKIIIWREKKNERALNLLLGRPSGI